MASLPPTHSIAFDIFLLWLFDQDNGTYKSKKEGNDACKDLGGGVLLGDLAYECFISPVQGEILLLLRQLDRYSLQKTSMVFENSPAADRLLLSITEKILEGDYEADYYKRSRTLTLKARVNAPPAVETVVVPPLAAWIISEHARITKAEEKTDFYEYDRFVYPVLPSENKLCQIIRTKVRYVRPTKDTDEFPSGKLHDGNRVEFSRMSFPASDSVRAPLLDMAKILHNLQAEVTGLIPPAGSDDELYKLRLTKFFSSETCQVHLPHLRRVIRLFSLVADNASRGEAELISTVKSFDMEHIDYGFDIRNKNALTSQTLYLSRNNAEAAGSGPFWITLASTVKEDGNKLGHKGGQGDCSIM